MINLTIRDVSEEHFNKPIIEGHSATFHKIRNTKPKTDIFRTTSIVVVSFCNIENELSVQI